MTVTLPGRAADDVLGGLVGELGGSLGVLLIALGNRCGLWTVLDGAGPLTPVALAGRTGVADHSSASGAARRPQADI